MKNVDSLHKAEYPFYIVLLPVPLSWNFFILDLSHFIRFYEIYYAQFIFQVLGCLKRSRQYSPL
jgi:hypothetical protein